MVKKTLLPFCTLVATSARSAPATTGGPWHFSTLGPFNLAPPIVSDCDEDLDSVLGTECEHRAPNVRP